MLTQITNAVLFAACIVILLGSIYLSLKLRFVQVRVLPALFKTFLSSKEANQQNKTAHTVSPQRALFTAMSTTLGISTIIGPCIAIRLGGPGALLGFLFTAFFGGAAVFTEVELAMQHRKALANGKIMGGPMQYLENLVSPWLAKWYAVGCLLLMVVWSGAQSNQLAAVLNSSFLGSYRISTTVSGLLIALFALITLTGGIRRLGSFSAKLIPVMFILYVGSCLWILGANIGGLGAAFYEVISSFLSPQALATGTVVGGVVAALRWGIFKGVQCCEAGIGTQTIPHSMAETDDPETQATLAILSTYTAGLVAFLSGMVAIVTGYWKDPSLSLGVEIMIASFAEYFSVAGVAVVSISTLLFGFGTILGNAYNGEQCYNYLLDNRGHRYYLLGIAVVIFLSAIAEVALVWTLIDLVLAAMAVPHIATLVFAVRKKEQIASTV